MSEAEALLEKIAKFDDLDWMGAYFDSLDDLGLNPTVVTEAFYISKLSNHEVDWSSSVYIELGSAINLMTFHEWEGRKFWEVMFNDIFKDEMEVAIYYKQLGIFQLLQSKIIEGTIDLYGVEIGHKGHKKIPLLELQNLVLNPIALFPDFVNDEEIISLGDGVDFSKFGASHPDEVEDLYSPDQWSELMVRQSQIQSLYLELFGVFDRHLLSTKVTLGQLAERLMLPGGRVGSRLKYAQAIEEIWKLDSKRPGLTLNQVTDQASEKFGMEPDTLRRQLRKFAKEDWRVKGAIYLSKKKIRNSPK